MRKIYRKPHQYKRKKPIYRNRFFWLGLLVLIFLLSTFYFLFLSPTFQVEKIIITGEDKVSTDALKSLIEKKLENKILFFKTKSIFLVNLDKIKKEILENFPQISEVEIKKGFLDSLSVVVIERLGIASWCQMEQCFLLDNEGIIFEEAFPEINLTKIINKQSSIPPKIGEKVIEKEKLSQIVLKIASELKTSLEIPIKEFQISAEDKLIALTEENWEIYFNLQGDIDWQITKLRAVLEEKIPPERRKDLEYIDVQFGNYAPFKYRAP